MLLKPSSLASWGSTTDPFYPNVLESPSLIIPSSLGGFSLLHRQTS
jgi:hypothetical protein